MSINCGEKKFLLDASEMRDPKLSNLERKNLIKERYLKLSKLERTNLKKEH